LIISILLRQSSIEKAIDIFREMNLNKLEPDSALYENVIAACIKNSKIKESIEFLISALKFPVSIDDKLCFSSIDGIIAWEKGKCTERAELMYNLKQALEEKGFEMKETLKEKINRFIYIQSNGGGNIYSSESIYDKKKNNHNKNINFSNKFDHSNRENIQNNNTTYINKGKFLPKNKSNSKIGQNQIPMNIFEMNNYQNLIIQNPVYYY